MFRSKKKAKVEEVYEDSETEDDISYASEISEVKEKKSRFSKLLRCGILKKKKKILDETAESDDDEYQSPSPDESIEQHNVPSRILRHTASVLTCGMLKKKKKTLQVESDETEDDVEDQSQTPEESEEDEGQSQSPFDSEEDIEYRSQTPDEFTEETASGKYKQTESLLRCDIVKKKTKNLEEESDESGDAAGIRRHSPVENSPEVLNRADNLVKLKKKKKKKKVSEEDIYGSENAIEVVSETFDEPAEENENTESLLRCDVVRTKKKKKKSSDEEIDESEDAAGIQSQTPVESEDAAGIQSQTPIESEDTAGIQSQTPTESVDAIGLQSQTPIESEDAIGLQSQTPEESGDSAGFRSQTPEDPSSKKSSPIYKNTEDLLRCSVQKKKKKIREKDIDESEYSIGNELNVVRMDHVEYCDDDALVSEDNYESSESEEDVDEVTPNQGEQGDQKKPKTKYLIGPGSAAGFAFVIRKAPEILSQKVKLDKKRCNFMKLFGKRSKKKKVEG